MPWVLTMPGIRGQERGKIHCSGPHPLERGFKHEEATPENIQAGPRALVRDAMDGTIEGLPFFWVQQDATGRLRHRTRQHGSIQNPPRQDAVERQTAAQALRRLELTCFNAATAFQNPMPDLHLPDIMPPKVEAFTRCTSHPRNGYATCSLWRCPSGLPCAAPLPTSRAGALSSPGCIASCSHIPLTLGFCQYREQFLLADGRM